MPNGILSDFERKLGLPSLTQVSKVLTALPDEKKLRLVKQILDSAAKVKGDPEELSMALELIRVIASADMEHLIAIRDITATLLKLLKALPSGALKTLPIKEIVEEIKG